VISSSAKMRRACVLVALIGMGIFVISFVCWLQLRTDVYWIMIYSGCFRVGRFPLPGAGTKITAGFVSDRLWQDLWFDWTFGDGGWVVSMPLWITVLPFVVRSLFRRNKGGISTCRNCGYEVGLLTAVRCPECGESLRRVSQR